MSKQSVFEGSYKKIVRAKNPEEIFGDLPQDRLVALEAARKIYLDLAKIVHPDHNRSDKLLEHMAGEATRELNDWYFNAKQKIEQGIYGQFDVNPAVVNPEFIYQCTNGVLSVYPNFIEGDFALLYPAKYSNHNSTNGQEQCLFKLAITEDENDLIVNEANILKLVSHKSLPVLIGEHKFEDGRRGNIIRTIDGGIDLVAVREIFPDGFPDRHVAWVLQRCLSVLGFLHLNFIIHSSIEPANIMMVSSNHNGLLIDFTLAIKEANKASARYSGLNEYSAPEIKKNTKPHPRTDIFSLGKSMIYLLGGNVDNMTLPDKVDRRFADFIMTLVDPNTNRRRDDAWEAYSYLVDLRTEIFGPNNFEPVIFPVTKT